MHISFNKSRVVANITADMIEEAVRLLHFKATRIMTKMSSRHFTYVYCFWDVTPISKQISIFTE